MESSIKRGLYIPNIAKTISQYGLRLSVIGFFIFLFIPIFIPDFAIRWPLLGLMQNFQLYFLLIILIMTNLGFIWVKSVEIGIYASISGFLLLGVTLPYVVKGDLLENKGMKADALKPSMVISQSGMTDNPDATLIPNPSLRILTFNLYPFNERLDEALDWILEQDADLILLQEVPLAMQKEVLSQLNPIYPNSEAQELYLSLGKVAITEATSLFDESAYGQRLVIEWQGQAIVVYNLHLPFPNEADNPNLSQDNPMLALIPGFILGYKENERNRVIREIIHKADLEHLPVIMGGDFNMNDSSATYQELAKGLVDAFYHSGNGFGFTWPFGASEELPDVLPPLLRLDYIWVKGGLIPILSQVGPALGSDHAPLMADFRWANE
ncbi:endonuclease/exonuclease/phosphatase family protein [Anaerolineales bacterium]